VSATVMLVRLLPGVVGESRRVVHVVAAPDDITSVPEVLTAFCGAQIAPGTAEVLPDLGGMPCELCFLAATPNASELPVISSVQTANDSHRVGRDPR
jgi:hypothetical protein